MCPNILSYILCVFNVFWCVSLSVSLWCMCLFAFNCAFAIKTPETTMLKTVFADIHSHHTLTCLSTWHSWDYQSAWAADVFPLYHFALPFEEVAFLKRIWQATLQSELVKFSISFSRFVRQLATFFHFPFSLFYQTKQKIIATALS
jgi:hypothetical protein